MKKITTLLVAVFGFTLASQAQNCVANFNSTQANCPTVDFTDASIAVLSTVDSWSWNFGDGATDTIQNPSHTYSANGNYDVQLVITAANGCTDTVVNTVAVTCIVPPPCVAGFDYVDDNCPQIIFVDSSSTVNDSIVSWTWSFGDGDSSNLQNPIHSYSNNGMYLVTLAIETNGGCSDTIEDSISVQCIPPPPCHADFQYNVSNCNDIQFQDLSVASDSIISWSWNFDDGQLSNLQNPQHTFVNNGTYNVCLTVATSSCSISYCDTISITCLPPPACEADFAINDGACPTLAFFDLSAGDSINFYAWDFGDGSTSAQREPEHTYTANGTYSICLDITTDGGCFSRYCQLYTVGCLGMEDEDLSISMYPNPASDVVNIELSDSRSNLQFSIYNSMGQLIETLDVSGETNIQFGLDNLQTGLYFVELSTEGQIILKDKIIKSN